MSPLRRHSLNMKESEYDVPFSTRNIRIHRLDWLGMDGPNCRSPSVAGDGHSGPADGALNVQCGPSTKMMYIYMFLRISFFVAIFCILWICFFCGISECLSMTMGLQRDLESVVNILAALSFHECSV